MLQGIAGIITRVRQAQVESMPLGATAFPAYGLPCKISSGTIIPITSTADPVYGILVKPFPTTGKNASDPLATAVPPTSGVADVLVGGYCSVFVQNVPASVNVGGVVYVRFQNPSGVKIVGGIESVTSADVYALTNARFMGNVDASGNAEIYIDNAGAHA
jgi:hypothetical protein